jgi:hypothetical protein
MAITIRASCFLVDPTKIIRSTMMFRKTKELDCNITAQILSLDIDTKNDKTTP